MFSTTTFLYTLKMNSSTIVIEIYKKLICSINVHLAFFILKYVVLKTATCTNFIITLMMCFLTLIG